MEERLFENDKAELRFVHNDYSREIPPVVEIYSNRLAITSYGGLIEGLSEDEFFKGRSMPQVTDQVTPEVETLIMAMQGEMTRVEIQKLLGLKDEKHFRKNYQQKSLKSGILEMTIPEKPNSRLQKYRLTPKGLEMKKQFNEMKKKN